MRIPSAIKTRIAKRPAIPGALVNAMLKTIAGQM
jgi:hypothetical protein